MSVREENSPALADIDAELAKADAEVAKADAEAERARSPSPSISSLSEPASPGHSGDETDVQLPKIGDRLEDWEQYRRNTHEVWDSKEAARILADLDDLLSIPK